MTFISSVIALTITTQNFGFLCDSGLKTSNLLLEAFMLYIPFLKQGLFWSSRFKTKNIHSVIEIYSINMAAGLKT